MHEVEAHNYNFQIVNSIPQIRSYMHSEKRIFYVIGLILYSSRFHFSNICEDEIKITCLNKSRLVAVNLIVNP